MLGPAFCAGFGNGLLLGYPVLNDTGNAPSWTRVSAPASGANFIFTVPEIAWEASLGIYLIAKGFRPSPILSGGPPRWTEAAAAARA